MKAFLFPGQGSQKLKMGLDLYENFPEAKEVFDEVDSALSYRLSSIIFGEDADLLNKTENTQVALMTMSIAVLRVLEAKSGKPINELCDFVCGHSLGEYSALVASRAMPLSIGARLLQARSKAMAEAVPQGSGAMMAIIGLDIDQVKQVVEKASTDEAKVSVANDNCPGQIVVSGMKQAVENASNIAKEMGAKKCVILPVSIPAHCPLMSSAKKIMEDTLAEIELNAPIVPFVSNRTANIDIDPVEIKLHLSEQMVNGVRFRECVDFMLSKGVDSFVEIGSGNVLSGLVKRCTDKANSTPLNTLETIDEYLNNL